jgi:hypothetical protein
MQTRTLAALLTLLAVPALAAAQAPDFKWTGTLAAGKTIEIRGVNGGISAEAAGGNTVEVTAVKRAEDSDPAEVKIEVVESSRGVTICAVYPTPRRSRHENHCGAGDDYEMSTSDNDVSVRFTVKVPRGVLLDAKTVNGDIRATGLTADAELNTVNGGIDVTTSGVVEAETVNGRITARIGRADWTGTLGFKTVNGGISLTAPGDLSADLDASAVNGGIDSDFPVTVNGRIDRQHLRGRIGTGGRTLELDTVNGGIEIKKGA